MGQQFRTSCDRCGKVTEYNDRYIHSQAACVAVQFMARGISEQHLDASRSFVETLFGRARPENGYGADEIVCDYCSDCATAVANMIKGEKQCPK
jgi:hypothetical protein